MDRSYGQIPGLGDRRPGGGNWPIQSNTFRNERRKKDGSGYTCLSWIDVCKS